MDDSYLDLSAKEIDTVVSFLGYGRLSAPVWFIGIEEGLGRMDSEDAKRNLKTRGTFENVMDLHRAHIRLQERGQPIDIERKPPSTQVWQWMAKIMRACNGYKNWQDLTSAKEYIRFCLGRCDGSTFLAEMSPIPADKTTNKKWMTWFKERDAELGIKIERRRNEIKLNLRKNAPPLAVCYGNSDKRADDFAELLGVEWHSVCIGVRASPITGACCCHSLETVV